MVRFISVILSVQLGQKREFGMFLRLRLKLHFKRKSERRKAVAKCSKLLSSVLKLLAVAACGFCLFLN